MRLRLSASMHIHAYLIDQHCSTLKLSAFNVKFWLFWLKCQILLKSHHEPNFLWTNGKIREILMSNHGCMKRVTREKLFTVSTTCPCRWQHVTLSCNSEPLWYFVSKKETRPRVVIFQSLLVQAWKLRSCQSRVSLSDKIIWQSWNNFGLSIDCNTPLVTQYFYSDLVKVWDFRIFSI